LRPYLLWRLTPAARRPVSNVESLSLLSNAVVVWNTVHMMRLITQLRASGEMITEEELARISPMAFAHVIPNGTHFTRRPSLEQASDPLEPLPPLSMEVGSND
jgi:Tn3 transposase DDE domain